MIPKVVLIDRDATLVCASSDPKSPLYYILTPQHLILKPGVKEAVAILAVHGVPVILCTKQRCISKGLITVEEMAIIHSRLERLIDLPFDHILIEPEHDNKLDLYRKVLKMYPLVNPQDIALFDDSPDERMMAARLGITTYDGADLYGSVCKAFNIR